MDDFDEDDLVQLSFLRDEETDALIAAGLLGEHLHLSSPLDDEVKFAYDEVILEIHAGSSYPVKSITFTVHNLSLPRAVIDKLRKELRELVSKAEETNNIENWRKRHDNAFGIFEPVMVVLQAVHKTITHLENYSNQEMGASNPGEEEERPDKHLWFLSNDAKRPVDVQDPISANEMAYRLLGLTPRQIAAKIHPSFRVLHLEQVLRTDLAGNLDIFRNRLRHTLSRLPTDQLRSFVPVELRTPRAADMVEHLVKPRVTFHGTPRQNVPGIVRHGFLGPESFDPTTGEELPVRCGSTYGRGTYSSPDANFALSYSGSKARRTSTSEFFGLKLIVCATIMGRSRQMYRANGWRNRKQAFEGADSHIANEGYEYVVFDAAQIIPVYVIHLDWGADNAEYFDDVPDDPREWAKRVNSRERLERRQKQEAARAMCPGDKQRAREAVFAKAAKYFPYGYGPATGKKFMVEEVGEASEDEEEYGDYQALRIQERQDHVSNTDFWSWIKASEAEEETLNEGIHDADEYLGQRHALRVPEGFRKKATLWDSIDMPGSEKAKKASRDEDDGYGLVSLMTDLSDVQAISVGKDGS